jgi:hypothetical protein
MLTSSWFDRPFGAWLSHLRKRLDLDGLARKSGAILRRRKIGDGGELLRLALTYGPGGCSLRETALRQSALGRRFRTRPSPSGWPGRASFWRRF